MLSTEIQTGEATRLVSICLQAIKDDACLTASCKSFYFHAQRLEIDIFISAAWLFSLLYQSTRRQQGHQFIGMNVVLIKG